MPWISTQSPPPTDKDQIYNGMDSLLTHEIFGAISALGPHPPAYRFERALQAPFLEIMQRGFRIDPFEREKQTRRLESEIVHLQSVLDTFSCAIWDRPLNANSPHQLKQFFYETMGFPEEFSSTKGERKVSVNREALEKLDDYFMARPLVTCILGLRERQKQLSVFKTEIDPDGRWRTSYNIGGTETGRLSSSASAFGTGSNSQNLAPQLKPMFVADPGYRLYSIDLEQAESREVGWLCGLLFDDWTYLDTCESGDLHTLTAKLIWPGLDWTGDPKADRKVAEQQFYREFSYRDMSKRGGHGSNYLGTPFTMARHLKVPPKLMEDFQDSYFTAFPGIQKWHLWVASELATKQTITTPFGFERTFFGRQNDPATLREAVAFSPQSSTAHRTNLALLRMWERLGADIQLLAQVHDAIVFQARESIPPLELAQAALNIIESVQTTYNGRTFKVPGECKCGWNWGYPQYDKQGNLIGNPDGLMKLTSSALLRTRTNNLSRVL